MKVAVVADFEKSIGFSLAGVNEVYTEASDIKKLLKRKRLNGIII